MNKINEDIQRYNILSSFLKSENNILVNRTYHYLLANTILFAFFSTNLPLSNKNLEIIIFSLGISIAGFYLTLNWFKSRKASVKWTEHWLFLLKNLENNAFPSRKGTYRILDDFKPPPKVKKMDSVKSINKGLPILFSTLWIIIILYSVICIIIVLIDKKQIISLLQQNEDSTMIFKQIINYITPFSTLIIAILAISTFYLSLRIKLENNKLIKYLIASNLIGASQKTDNMQKIYERFNRLLEKLDNIGFHK